MTTIARRKCHTFASPVDLSPGGDLWRYAPVKDAKGRSFCDLMMLLPRGLQRDRNLAILTRHQLQDVLEGFGDQVLFADLNLRLGIIWVSVTSEPGLCAEVAEAIHARIEGARVVGNYLKRPKSSRLQWISKIKRLLT